MTRFNAMHLFVALSAYIFIYVDTTLSLEIRISPDAPELTKRHGDGLFLTCSLFPELRSTAVNLQWINPQNQVVTNTNASGNLYIARENGELYLYVVEVKKNHDGNWTCKTVIDEQTFEKSILLSTWKPITFINPRRLQQPIAGTTYLIECNVESEPIATVTWTIKGRPYTGEGGRYTQESTGLKVRNISEADNGLYDCKAEITQKGQMEILRIRIAVVDGPPTFSQRLTPVYYTIGNNVVLMCASEDNVTYSFYHNGTLVASNRSIGVYWISNPDDLDAGAYTCRIENEHGGANSTAPLSQASLTIYPSNTTFHDECGQNCFINCSFALGTGTSVMWYRNGQPIYLRQSRYKVRTVRRHSGRITDSILYVQGGFTPMDNGAFRCLGTNPNTNRRDGIKYLIILAEPKVETPVRIKYPSLTRTSLSCDISGYPRPYNVTWFFNGSSVLEEVDVSPSTRFGVYTSVIQVENTALGVYTCEARNSLGSNSTTITLQARHRPYKPSVTLTWAWPRLDVYVTPAADDGGSRVISFTVSVMPYRSSTAQPATTQTGYVQQGMVPPYSARFPMMELNTRYYVRAVITSGLGDGEPVELISTAFSLN